MLPYRDYKKSHSNFVTNKKSVIPNVAGSIKLKVIFLSLFLLVGMAFTQLVFANSLATGGEKLSKVQEEINQLERENMTLRSEIAKTSSLTKLSSVAQRNGFVKPQTVTVVD